MVRTLRRASPVARLTRVVLSLLVLSLVAAVALPAAASQTPQVIVLPGATSAEGIAAGRGATFYAGDLFAGDIFRGNVRRGTAELFIDAPVGRMAVGMAADLQHDLLFVAGGFTGQAYVYDLGTGASVASYDLGDPETSIINDVTVTKAGAWFTDSFQARLSFVPVSRAGVPGPSRTLALSGSGGRHQRGLQPQRHPGHGQRQDPDRGPLGQRPALHGQSEDRCQRDHRQGERASGRRHRAAGSALWAVQNSNQVTRIRLDGHLASGVVEKVITSDLFQVPATAALFGRRLAVVNAKFDTGIPPTATQFEVVLVNG